jgi:septal ring factor EnvC (AmiA/AmiB activator)
LTDKELNTILADLDKAEKERAVLGTAAARIRDLEAELIATRDTLKHAQRRIAELEVPPPRPPELNLDEAREAQRLLRALAGSLENYIDSKTPVPAPPAPVAEENPIPKPRSKDLSANW